MPTAEAPGFEHDEFCCTLGSVVVVAGAAVVPGLPPPLRRVVVVRRPLLVVHAGHDGNVVRHRFG